MSPKTLLTLPGTRWKQRHHEDTFLSKNCDQSKATGASEDTTQTYEEMSDLLSPPLNVRKSFEPVFRAKGKVKPGSAIVSLASAFAASMGSPNSAASRKTAKKKNANTKTQTQNQGTNSGSPSKKVWKSASNENDLRDSLKAVNVASLSGLLLDESSSIELFVDNTRDDKEAKSLEYAKAVVEKNSHGFFSSWEEDSVFDDKKSVAPEGIDKKRPGLERQKSKEELDVIFCGESQKHRGQASVNNQNVGGVLKQAVNLWMDRKDRKPPKKVCSVDSLRPTFDVRSKLKKSKSHERFDPETINYDGRTRNRSPRRRNRFPRRSKSHDRFDPETTNYDDRNRSPKRPNRRPERSKSHDRFDPERTKHDGQDRSPTRPNRSPKRPSRGWSAVRRWVLEEGLNLDSDLQEEPSSGSQRRIQAGADSARSDKSPPGPSSVIETKADSVPQDKPPSRPPRRGSADCSPRIDPSKEGTHEVETSTDPVPQEKSPDRPDLEAKAKTDSVSQDKPLSIPTRQHSVEEIVSVSSPQVKANTDAPLQDAPPSRPQRQQSAGDVCSDSVPQDRTPSRPTRKFSGEIIPVSVLQDTFPSVPDRHRSLEIDTNKQTTREKPLVERLMSDKNFTHAKKKQLGDITRTGTRFGRVRDKVRKFHSQSAAFLHEDTQDSARLRVRKTANQTESMKGGSSSLAGIPVDIDVMTESDWKLEISELFTDLDDFSDFDES